MPRCVALSGFWNGQTEVCCYPSQGARGGGRGQTRQGTDRDTGPRQGDHTGKHTGRATTHKQPGTRTHEDDATHMATQVSNEQFGAFVAATGFVTDSERFGWSFVFEKQLTAQANAQV